MKRRQYLKRSGTVGGAVLTAGLAGCTGDGNGDGSGSGNGATTGDAGDGLADSLTIYTNIPFDPVQEAYEASSGVDLNVVTLGGPQPNLQYVAEWQQEQYEADVIASLDTSTWLLHDNDIPAEIELDQQTIDELWHHDGMAEAWENEVGRDLREYSVPHINQIGSFIYNTDEVTDPPTTWEDLTDSQWEDRMCIQPFTMDYVMQMIEEDRGSIDEAADWIVDFDANNPQYLAGGGTMVDSLLAGENHVSAYIWGMYASADVDAGSPIDLVFPEPTGMHSQVINVPKEAPNLETAKHFAEWVASPEGQEASQQINGGAIPAREGYGYGNDHVQQRWDESDQTPITVTVGEETAESYNERIEDLIGLELTS